MAKPNVTLAVRHLHWLNWPDHGVPLQQLAPLRLIHFLDGYRRIVIHCSAGKFLMVFFFFHFPYINFPPQESDEPGQFWPSSVPSTPCTPVSPLTSSVLSKNCEHNEPGAYKHLNSTCTSTSSFFGKFFFLLSVVDCLTHHFYRYAKNKAERGEIEVDVAALDKSIKAISARLYRAPSPQPPTAMQQIQNK